MPEAQTRKECGDVPSAQWAVASHPQLLILACCQSLGLLLGTRRATFVWVAEQCKVASFDATKELHLEFVPLVCSQGKGLLEVKVTFSRERHFLRGSHGVTGKIQDTNLAKHNNLLTLFELSITYSCKVHLCGSDMYCSFVQWLPLSCVCR